MLNNKYYVCVFLVLSRSVFASPLPGSGSQMLQIPPEPILQKSTPKIEIEQGQAMDVPGLQNLRIIVNNLKLVNAHAYSEQELYSISGFKPGSELTLADLRGIATQIERYYHRNGYFVAQVYLPAQDIKDGVVILIVSEGRYGNITLRNKAGLSGGLADSLLEGLTKGDTIASAPLENRLLLISDLPGVQARSVLLPGASVGASDLIVDVIEGQRITGSLDADNAGNRYTGANRLGVTANLNEPLGRGDVATLRILTSGGGLSFGRIAYQMQYGKVKAGVAYSSLGYSLGQEFELLGAGGTATITSLFAAYPLIRLRENNMYAQLAGDSKSFHDTVESSLTVTDKRVHVLMASLVGDRHDRMAGDGFTRYSFTWSAGKLDIQTPLLQTSDAATSKTNGNFRKFGTGITRMQNVTELTSLYAAFNGQYAYGNLDVSEKMELGGMYAVRAYPEGEAYADQGYVLNLEGRVQLPQLSGQTSGQMQLVGFVDTGTVTENKNPWATGQNRRTLSGTGLGLNWTGENNFVVKAYYAHKLGDAVATSAPDSSGQFRIQAVKFF